MFAKLFSSPHAGRAKDVTLRDRERLFFMLGMMFRCGQTAVSGLRTVSRAFFQENRKDVAAALDDIAEKIEQGKPFNRAVAAEPALFNDVDRAALLAGEASNNMAKSFTVLHELEQRKIASRRAGMAEILTPLLLLVLSCVSMMNTGLNTLPTMSKLAEAQKKPIGALPSAIMDITQFMANYWFFLVAFVLIVGIVVHQMYSTANGRHTMHGLTLKMPFYGKYVRFSTYAQMLLYFPYMLQSGVSPKQMIPIMEAITQNGVLKERVKNFNDTITTGGTMGQAMEEAGFPEIVVTPVKVSENYTGEGRGINTLMVEAMQHAHEIMDQMLRDTHTKFVVVTASSLWILGGLVLLLDMVSIVLSQQ